MCSKTPPEPAGKGLFGQDGIIPALGSGGDVLGQQEPHPGRVFSPAGFVGSADSTESLIGQQ